MRRHSVLIVSIICVVIYIIFNSGAETFPVEDINIASGLSYDLIKKTTGKEYIVSSTVYTFNKKDEISSFLLEASAQSLPETRSKRQTIDNKKFILGLNKVMIFSHDFAADGITPITNSLFKNQEVNDTGWIVVCKGRAQDMLKYKVADFPSSSDYISGMIESSKEQNFMSQDYKIVDMYVRVNSEGRNLVLPYLDIVDNNISITGMGIFKKDKMVSVIPIDEAKYMNILRTDNVKGVLSVQKDSNHYTCAYGQTKRKVRCERVNDKYKFTINVEFSGKIINNTLYMDLIKEAKTLKKFEEELAESAKKRCSSFISKMQKEYKTDCIELGREAAATFGRNSGVDWNDVVLNSQIIVNVKVKINNFGRGHFLFEEN